MQTTPTDEVGDATAQVVEYVVALFSDSDTRDVENERDYLEGTVEALASERAARRRALDAVREARVRFFSRLVRARLAVLAVRAVERRSFAVLARRASVLHFDFSGNRLL